MNAVVTVERHYRATPQGVFGRGAETAGFFGRYLPVYDQVLVLGRVAPSPDPPGPLETPVESERVRVLPLTDFRGAAGLLRVAPRLLRELSNAAGRSDSVFVLRVPGFVSLLFWVMLVARRRPYGVEVVADPAQAYRPSAFGGGWLARLLRWITTRVLRAQCAGAAATSYVTESELQRKYPPGSGPSYHYSSIVLPEAALQRAEATISRLTGQPDRLDFPRLAFVGNLDRPFKGLDILIEAVSLLHQGDGIRPRLVVVGDGRLRTQYEEQAARLGVAGAVDFQGYLPPGDSVLSVLAQSDVFVLPSRREGLPRVIIEAMAVGLPCVCTDVSGARELLEEPFVIAQDAPQELADAIRRFAESRALRVQTAQRNAQVARRYADAELQPRREDFYQALIRSSKN